MVRSLGGSTLILGIKAASLPRLLRLSTKWSHYHPFHLYPAEPTYSCESRSQWSTTLGCISDLTLRRRTSTRLSLDLMLHLHWTFRFEKHLAPSMWVRRVTLAHNHLILRLLHGLCMSSLYPNCFCICTIGSTTGVLWFHCQVAVVSTSLSAGCTQW